MTEDVALVPIPPPARDKWIALMIRAKHVAAAEVLSGRPVAEIEKLPQLWYEDAVHSQFMLHLNLCILQLGTPDGQDRVVWAFQAGHLQIVATYHNRTTATEVKVNNHLVVWNGSPEKQYFNSGEWMYIVQTAYDNMQRAAQQRADEKVWVEEMAERARQQKVILDLTAPV